MTALRIGKLRGVVTVVAASLLLSVGVLVVGASPVSASKKAVASVDVAGPLPTAIIGFKYQVRLVGGGGSRYTLTQRRVLPRGIRLRSNGVLSGKPNKRDTPGVYSFRVQSGSNTFAEALRLVDASATAAGGNCTHPVWSGSQPEDTYNVDSNDAEYWWVNNDAWNGSHGPQTIYVCNQASWYAVSQQPNNQGQVETYPDTEYDVGGRNSPSSKPISQYSSITSTFSENYPSAGSWDAAYDLWLNNWSFETMIWNQWSGAQDYWPEQASISVNLGGVPYKFYDNGTKGDSGGELMFFRQTQVTSGSVDILAAYQWLVDNGYVSASAVPTQLEYGVEICSTNGAETFPMTGLTFSLS